MKLLNLGTFATRKWYYSHSYKILDKRLRFSFQGKFKTKKESRLDAHPCCVFAPCRVRNIGKAWECSVYFLVGVWRCPLEDKLTLPRFLLLIVPLAIGKYIMGPSSELIYV